MEHEAGSIGVAIKIVYTLFICLLVPIYARYYGPANFLWFSDIALLTTVAALWLESRFLASTMALGAAVPELAWNVDYFGRLLTGRQLIGLSDYMFDASKPLFLRALSLFHVALPILLFWMLHRLGYDRRAFVAQTVLMWSLLLLSYLFTDPARNINWAFGPGNQPQSRIPAPLYLALLMAFFPLVIYWPTHALLGRLFAKDH